MNASDTGFKRSPSFRYTSLKFAIETRENARTAQDPLTAEGVKFCYSIDGMIRTGHLMKHCKMRHFHGKK